MKYTIVPTSEDYIDDFWTALDSVARERQYIAWIEGPPKEATLNFIKGLIKDGDIQFLALVDGKVVGWCDITRIRRPLHAHCGTLGMGVMKDFRGLGIGQALMQASLEKAWSIGLARVELTVRAGNARALGLYKKVGFSHEGVKKDAVCLDGAYEDLICMGLVHKDRA